MPNGNTSDVYRDWDNKNGYHDDNDNDAFEGNDDDGDDCDMMVVMTVLSGSSNCCFGVK